MNILCGTDMTASSTPRLVDREYCHGRHLQWTDTSARFNESPIHHIRTVNSCSLGQSEEARAKTPTQGFMAFMQVQMDVPICIVKSV